MYVLTNQPVPKIKQHVGWPELIRQLKPGMATTVVLPDVNAVLAALTTVYIAAKRQGVLVSVSHKDTSVTIWLRCTKQMTQPTWMTERPACMSMPKLDWLPLPLP